MADVTPSLDELTAPLTCEWCDNSPVTQVFVVDYRRMGRHASLVCAPCGGTGGPEARRFGMVWRYELTPLTSADTKPVEAEAAS